MVRPSTACKKKISHLALYFSDRCRLFHVSLAFNSCLANEPRLTLCMCAFVCVCVLVYVCEQIERPDFHAQEDGKDDTYHTETRPVNLQQDSRQEAASNDILGEESQGVKPS